MVSRAAPPRGTRESAQEAWARSRVLAQKLDSIERLAGGLAHDFNNMLFAIRGHAELLAEDLASADPARLDPEHLRLSVGAIAKAAERAATLNAQLLAIASQDEPVTTELVHATLPAAGSRRTATDAR